jgi:hypothetical protein
MPGIVKKHGVLLMQRFTHHILKVDLMNATITLIMFTTRAINKNGDFEARNIVILVVTMGQKPSATGENILPIL